MSLYLNMYNFSGNECIVYLESYFKTGNDVVTAYVDFRTRKDQELFNERLKINTENSFIELRSLKTSKRLRQGCYYKLNLDIFKDEGFIIEQDSFVIGATYDLSEMKKPENDDEEVFQHHNLLDPEELKMHIPIRGSLEDIIPDQLEVFVKDVDQANWNELRQNGQVVVLFDAGAKLNATISEIVSIFQSRERALESSKPILVISHWDIDHIHCLKYLDNNQIEKSFSKLVCVDMLKSLTSQRIMQKLRDSLGDDNIFCLPVRQRTDGLRMYRWKSFGAVSFYQGQQSPSVNYCGIVMFVQGRNGSVNFTGDCKLIQAKDVYLQEYNQVGDYHHLLIAPHHGGDTGAQYRQYMLPCQDIAISVGQYNRYGHPNCHMLKYLSTLGNIRQTDIHGDLSFHL